MVSFKRAALALLVGSSLLLSGCGFVQGLLQSKVNELNKGIADTAKQVGTQVNQATQDTTKGLGEALGGKTNTTKTDTTKK